MDTFVACSSDSLLLLELFAQEPSANTRVKAASNAVSFVSFSFFIFSP